MFSQNKTRELQRWPESICGCTEYSKSKEKRYAEEKQQTGLWLDQYTEGRITTSGKKGQSYTSKHKGQSKFHTPINRIERDGMREMGIERDETCG